MRNSELGPLFDYNAEYALLTSAEKERICSEFDRILEATAAAETVMADAMTVYCLFGRCFFDHPELRTLPRLHETYLRYSAKLLPFLTRALPLKIDDDVVSIFNDAYFGHSKVLDTENILTTYCGGSSGAGIVIPCATRDAHDVVRLLHLLRAQNNRLPIQIIYHADLLTL